MRDGGGILEQVRDKWWESLRSNGDIELQVSNSRSFQVPANTHNPRIHCFESAGITLPRAIPATTAENKNDIMWALYDSLNTKYSTGLAPPNPHRQGGISESDGVGGRLIFVDASHCTKIVEEGNNTAHSSYPDGDPPPTSPHSWQAGWLK